MLDVREVMNPPFKQLIVGSWEQLSTTANGCKPEWAITHFSADGFFTIDLPENQGFVPPERYTVDDDQLIFRWESWGKEDRKVLLSLEPNGDLKAVDNNGVISIHRKVQDLRQVTFAYIDEQGKLRKRKTEPPASATPPRPGG